MTVLFASDLDRTLIYSKNSRGLEVEETDLVAVEWINGIPVAYMTKKGITLFHQLSSKLTFLPVTTRTKHQFERITGLFNANEVPKYAIVSNGAVILENGIPMGEWSNKVEKRLQQDCTSIQDVTLQLDPYIRKGFIGDVKQAESWFVYLTIDEKTCSVEDLEQLSQNLYQQGYTLSRQGRKVYVMPNCINKSAAVEFVQDQMEVDLVIAAGDSVLDYDMVMNADRGFFPLHGEVAQSKGAFPSRIEITQCSGVLAGEEILKRIENLLL